MLNTDDLRYYTGIGTGYSQSQMMERAAFEIDRLRGEIDEVDDLREKMGGILSTVAVALKGEPPPLTLWDWSDLGDVAKAKAQEIERLREALMGARVVLDRMRTSKETKFSHAMARDGAMVHIHAVVASIDAALTPNAK